MINWLTSFMGRGLISWNVKIYSCDLDFENLRKSFVEAYGKEACNKDWDCPTWIAGCKELHAETSSDALWEWGTEGAWRDFIDNSRGSGGAPGNCGYSTLWSGEEVDIIFGCEGRSGGHLVIREFEGLDFARGRLRDPDAWEEVDIGKIRKLAEMVQMVDHSLRTHPPRKRVEECAAWDFFVNVCENQVDSKADLVKRWEEDQSGEH
jgi:hypothetical protein